MEEQPRKQGRPKKDASKHKRNRGISMTDAEYKKLSDLASKATLGVSEYVIKKLGLDS